MSRLIDADALLESAGLFEAKASARGCGKSILHLAKAWLWNEVNKAPTVDAVPVVRCRECKSYVIVDEFDGGKRYMCLVNHFSYLDNDGDNHFCSYGEQKEGDDLCQNTRKSG